MSLGQLRKTIYYAIVLTGQCSGGGIKSPFGTQRTTIAVADSVAKLDQSMWVEVRLDQIFDFHSSLVGKLVVTTAGRFNPSLSPALLEFSQAKFHVSYLLSTSQASFTRNSLPTMVQYVQRSQRSQLLALSHVAKVVWILFGFEKSGSKHDPFSSPFCVLVMSQIDCL